MKKTLTLSAIILVSILVNAQHTISFNQVKLIDNVSQTVPNGKVWKVQSLLPSSNSIQSIGNGYTSDPGVGVFSISVNSTTIYASKVEAATSNSYYSSGKNYSFTNVNTGILPMWLPEGTTLAASTGIKYISIVEFIVN